MNENERKASKLIEGARRGDAAALNELLGLIYPELRQRARALMSKGWPGNTLSVSGSDLVQKVIETILAAGGSIFSVVATERDLINLLTWRMRRLLVDHARSKQTTTRFNPRRRVPWDKIQITDPAANIEQVMLYDGLLNKLARKDRQAAGAFELRAFGGLTNDEAAEVMGLSVSTFRRALLRATVLLKAMLEDPAA
jgi:RNA polymerase sigma factor (TIGR02999 family)